VSGFLQLRWETVKRQAQIGTLKIGEAEPKRLYPFAIGDKRHEMTLL